MTTCNCTGKCTCVKPFKMANHKLGITAALIFTGIYSLLMAGYNAIRAPYEAQLGAMQVEDSAVTWNLYHNIVQNDAILWIVSIIFISLIGLCLFPAVKDAVQN